MLSLVHGPCNVWWSVLDVDTMEGGGEEGREGERREGEREEGRPESHP